MSTPGGGKEDRGHKESKDRCGDCFLLRRLAARLEWEWCAVYEPIAGVWQTAIKPDRSPLEHGGRHTLIQLVSIGLYSFPHHLYFACELGGGTSLSGKADSGMVVIAGLFFEAPSLALSGLLSFPIADFAPS